eukprot:s325_g16.t2
MCGESEQTSMAVFGLIVGSVFVLAFYVGCIYAACHMPSWSVQDMTAALSSFRFLSSNFRLNCWWFGLLLLARGFGFSLVIVVATDTASAQTSLATLILVLYGFSQASVWPWKAAIINVFDVVLSALLLLLVNKAQTRPQTESANDDWDFSRIFTLVLLLLIAAALATLILASLCAVLVFYLSNEKQRNRRTMSFTNFSKPAPEGAVIDSLQQVVEEFSRSERHQIEENLAVMNHYDFKAVVDAIHIISSSVLPLGELPAEMKPSLRICKSNISLKSRASITSIGSLLSQDWMNEATQPDLPELEQMEPEEAATTGTATEADVNASAGAVESLAEIDSLPNEAQNGASEAAATSSNLTELEPLPLRSWCRDSHRAWEDCGHRTLNVDLSTEKKCFVPATRCAHPHPCVWCGPAKVLQSKNSYCTSVLPPVLQAILQAMLDRIVVGVFWVLAAIANGEVV